MSRVLVAGAGGFIGGYLVQELLHKGHSVRAVDKKPFLNWYQIHANADNLVLDLQSLSSCEIAVDAIDEVFNLAADMGGMGFIENHKALCMLSVLINTHLLSASINSGINKFFFASSACVYASSKQVDPTNPGLREGDAYPAMPEDGYGWEKLFSERMCRHFFEDFGLETRIARFHNVYGPKGTWDGGREKAPAAICRKIAIAKITGVNEIEIWGDGNQSRSFMWIDDCVKGINLIMNSNYRDPLNLGSSELVSINQLVDIVEDLADIKVKRNYNLNAPQGVRGRNSDNSLIKSLLKWEPSTSLVDGLKQTYDWVAEQVEKQVNKVEK